MRFELNENVQLQKIDVKGVDFNGFQLLMQREDEIDPEISGNKWFKLRFYLERMVEEGKKGVLTFGGAFSNHIAATAAAGKRFGFQTIGFIRGQELTHDSNQTLMNAHKNGMELKFIERSEYKHRNDREYLKLVKQTFSDYLIIPEGGGGILGLSGAIEMGKRYQNYSVDEIWVSVGTGTTALGIAIANPDKNVVGVNCTGYSLEEEYLNKTLAEMGMSLDEISNFSLISNSEESKFGQIKDDEITFGCDFYEKNNFRLDPIYTQKMLLTFSKTIEKQGGILLKNTLIIHTGGLQGIQEWTKC